MAKQARFPARDALTTAGRKVTPAALLSYAQGFMEVAIARGW